MEDMMDKSFEELPTETFLELKRKRIRENRIHELESNIQDDIESAFNWLSSKGVNFALGGIREGASGHRVCFLHPRPSQTHPLSGEGVLIELVEAPKEIVRKFETQSQY